MSRAAERVDPAREFEKLVRSLDSHQPWRVFADFAELGALSLACRVVGTEAREVRYKELITTYKPDERKVFPEMLNCVVRAIVEADGEVDFLGHVFQSMELANHWKGQFFTPFEVCRLMADLTFVGVEDIIRAQGFVRVHEPACGSGATILAASQALRRRNIDPSRHMWFNAVDIDPTAAHMAFIQLSLCGVPGEVVIGDTLRMQFGEVYRTPYHYLGMWDARLTALRAIDALKAVEARPPAAPAPEPEPGEVAMRRQAASRQMRMF